MEAIKEIFTEGWGCSLKVECLSSLQEALEALGSIPNVAKTNKKTCHQGSNIWFRFSKMNKMG
jgi:hypothetical protein